MLFSSIYCASPTATMHAMNSIQHCSIPYTLYTVRCPLKLLCYSWDVLCLMHVYFQVYSTRDFIVEMYNTFKYILYE